MALTASKPALTRAPGVYVSMGHNGSDGYGPTKVEVYCHLECDWRGQTHAVEATADRYRHSSGWSDWRVVVYRTDPGTTDTARRAISDAVRPLVLEWVTGDDYAPAYRSALAQAIARELRDDRYGTDGTRRLISALPIGETDRDRLTLAANRIDEVRCLLDSIGEADA